MTDLAERIAKLEALDAARPSKQRLKRMITRCKGKYHEADIDCKCVVGEIYNFNTSISIRFDANIGEMLIQSRRDIRAEDEYGHHCPTCSRPYDKNTKEEKLIIHPLLTKENAAFLAKYLLMWAEDEKTTT